MGVIIFDFLRVRPSDDHLLYEHLCAQPQWPSWSVLGEWDVLRISCSDTLFHPSDSDPLNLPPSLGVLNHQRFVGRSLAGMDGGRALAHLHRQQAMPSMFGLVTCLKLNPAYVAQYGRSLEERLAEWLLAQDASAGRIVCSSLGWAEVLVFEEGASLAQCSALLHKLHALTSYDLEIGLDGPAGTVLAKSVTYPLVPMDGHQEGLAEEEVAACRLLVAQRPGTNLPRLLETSNLRVAREYGEYDYSIHLGSPVSLRSALAQIRAIRKSSGSNNDWLICSNTVIETLGVPQVHNAAKPMGLLPPPPEMSGLLGLLSKTGGGFLEVGSPLVRARLRQLLRRVHSLAQEPALRESVRPLLRYCERLAARINEDAAEAHGLGFQFMVEFDDPHGERLCSLLEQGLNERSEGLQQFWYNALPSSYHARGGLNRVSAAADALVREVGLWFGLDSPGFVVFGAPIAQGPSSFGPLVSVPQPILFDKSRWWLLVHEAANYIDEIIFAEGAAQWAAPQNDLVESRKLVADTTTFALAFRFRLDLATSAYAKELVLAGTADVDERWWSVMIRLATVAVLADLFFELHPLADEMTRPERDWIGGFDAEFVAGLERRIYAIRQHGPDFAVVLAPAYSAAEMFRNTLVTSSEERFGPHEHDDVFAWREELLADAIAQQLSSLLDFWRSAYRSESESGARAKLGFIALVLLLQECLERSTHDVDRAMPNARFQFVLPSDCLHRSLSRTHRDEASTHYRDILDVWHAGTALARYRELLRGAGTPLLAAQVLTTRNVNTILDITGTNRKVRKVFYRFSPSPFKMASRRVSSAGNTRVGLGGAVEPSATRSSWRSSQESNFTELSTARGDIREHLREWLRGPIPSLDRSLQITEPPKYELPRGEEEVDYAQASLVDILRAVSKCRRLVDGSHHQFYLAQLRLILEELEARTNAEPASADALTAGHLVASVGALIDSFGVERRTE